MPGVKPPEDVRLPGPHYVLENALVEDIGSEESERRKTASIADRWFRNKPLAERKRSDFGNNKKIPYDFSRPQLPFFLAQARGVDTTAQQDQNSEDKYKAMALSPTESGSFLSPVTGYGPMPHTPLPPHQGFSSLSIDPNMDPHLMPGATSQHHQLPTDYHQGTFLSPYSNQYTDSGHTPQFPFPTRSYSYSNS